jgi:hypothetical protein
VSSRGLDFELIEGSGRGFIEEMLEQELTRAVRPRMPDQAFSDLARSREL